MRIMGLKAIRFWTGGEREKIVLLCKISSCRHFGRKGTGPIFSDF